MTKNDRRILTRVPSRGGDCFVMYNNHKNFCCFAVRAGNADQALEKVVKYCAKKRIRFDLESISSGWIW